MLASVSERSSAISVRTAWLGVLRPSVSEASCDARRAFKKAATALFPTLRSESSKLDLPAAT